MCFLFLQYKIKDWLLIILGDLFITLLSQVGTWTPKKGKVAEPGFCGHAPGKGVI